MTQRACLAPTGSLRPKTNENPALKLGSSRSRFPMADIMPLLVLGSWIFFRPTDESYSTDNFKTDNGLPFWTPRLIFLSMLATEAITCGKMLVMALLTQFGQYAVDIEKRYGTLGSILQGDWLTRRRERKSRAMARTFLSTSLIK